MIDINERQDQQFTSRSNIYVCDNNGCNKYLQGVNALLSITSVTWSVSDQTGELDYQNDDLQGRSTGRHSLEPLI